PKSGAGSASTASGSPPGSRSTGSAGIAGRSGAAGISGNSTTGGGIRATISAGGTACSTTTKLGQYASTAKCSTTDAASEIQNQRRAAPLTRSFAECAFRGGARWSPRTPAPAVDPEPPRAADPSSGVRPPGGPVAVPRPADGSFPLRAAIYTSTPAHRLTRTSRGQAGAPAVPPAGGQAQRKARPIRARCLRRWLCSGPDRRIVRLAARGGRTPAVAAG